MIHISILRPVKVHHTRQLRARINFYFCVLRSDAGFSERYLRDDAVIVQLQWESQATHLIQFNVAQSSPSHHITFHPIPSQSIGIVGVCGIHDRRENRCGVARAEAHPATRSHLRFLGRSHTYFGVWEWTASTRGDNHKDRMLKDPNSIASSRYEFYHENDKRTLYRHSGPSPPLSICVARMSFYNHVHHNSFVRPTIFWQSSYEVALSPGLLIFVFLTHKYFSAAYHGPLTTV